MQPAQYAEAAQAPPAVAHVLQLLRPPVEAAAPRLPLRQPPADQVCVTLPEGVGKGQGPDAGEHLAGVGFVACRQIEERRLL